MTQGPLGSWLGSSALSLEHTGFALCPLGRLLCSRSCPQGFQASLCEASPHGVPGTASLKTEHPSTFPSTLLPCAHAGRGPHWLPAEAGSSRADVSVASCVRRGRPSIQGMESSCGREPQHAQGRRPA